MRKTRQVRRSPGGCKILDFDASEGVAEILAPDPDLAGRITRHVGKYFRGKQHLFVEGMSECIRVDLLVHEPTSGQPHWTIVTVGMSSKRLCPPPGGGRGLRAELMLRLPEDWWPREGWPGRAALGDRWWPVDALVELARFPHRCRTWIAPGITIANADPAEPYAPSTELCCALIAEPVSVPEPFRTLELGAEEQIDFLGVVPLFESEMNLKLAAGPVELDRRLQTAGIDERLDPQRVPIDTSRRSR